MLENTRYLLKTAKKLTVSYFGGSITEMKGWRGMTESWMREAFPERGLQTSTRQSAAQAPLGVIPL